MNKKTRSENGKIPHFTKPFQAALWIREEGWQPLTNQTFRGLLMDLIGGSLSEDESDTIRVLSRPGNNLVGARAPMEGYLTHEEGITMINSLNKAVNKPNLSFEETDQGIFIRFYD